MLVAVFLINLNLIEVTNAAIVTVIGIVVSSRQKIIVCRYSYFFRILYSFLYTYFGTRIAASPIS